MTTLVRLGTRGSPLALTQTAMVAEALRAAHDLPADAIETVVVQTTGDKVQDRPLADIGGKALWTKELDAALMSGRIDVAVHSMKDVETQLAPGIGIAAMLPRADARDRLIGAESLTLIPQGAVVGTSSPRRAAQLLHRRPDVTVIPLRGNVATRLAKLEAGEVAATFLAAAGLDRLGIEVGTPLDLLDWTPAVAQGAIGIATRAGDQAMTGMLAAIDHPQTHQAVSAERSFLAALGGTCHSPVAVHASIDGEELTLTAELLSGDGRSRIGDLLRCRSCDAQELAAALAARMLADAPDEIRRLFAG